MAKYRLVESIDWDALQGQRVTIELSANYVQVALKDGTLVTLAKAKQVRRPAVKASKPSTAVASLSRYPDDREPEHV